MPIRVKIVTSPRVVLKRLSSIASDLRECMLEVCARYRDVLEVLCVKVLLSPQALPS